MLTESEKRWLAKRQHYPYFACSTCIWRDTNLPARLSRMKKGYIHGCNFDCAGFFNPIVTKEDLLEAAEFEQRVAASFAMMMLCPNDEKYPCRHGIPELGCMRTKTKLTGPMAVHCEDCILREVRLQVEEEMEKCIK